ncbi:hypothetical protein CR513_19953, partial [Mucuna pruriens]
MGNNRIRIGHLIASNMKDSHFGQDRTSRLSTADSVIPSTTFPTTTTTTESAYPRQLSISGRPNEAACNQQPGVLAIYLKTQIGQLANTVSQLQSAGSSNLPSQTIPNPRGNASVVTLRSGKELAQPTLQQEPRSVRTDSKQNADLTVSARESCPTAISISDHLGKEARVR